MTIFDSLPNELINDLEKLVLSYAHVNSNFSSIAKAVHANTPAFARLRYQDVFGIVRSLVKKMDKDGAVKIYGDLRKPSTCRILSYR